MSYLFSFQELQSELEFIQSLARDLHQRCQALPVEVPDDETDEITDKLERLQRQISELDKEFPRASQRDSVVAPGREGASAFVEHLPEVVLNKAAAHEAVENGDSDLGDSESGVSSMESFEGILRKENGHAPGEIGVQENGVSEKRSASDESDEDLHPNGGMSVTPDEYQRIRMNQSAEANEGITSNTPNGLENGDYSRDLDNESGETNEKSRDVSVPLLTVTDEDGTPTEVAFAENAPENNLDNGDDESFPDQGGEFFIDDFDVYYGQTRPKNVVEPDRVSDNTVVPESEKEEPDGENLTNKDESRTDDIENRSQDSSVSDQVQGSVKDDHSCDLVKVRDQQATESVITEITLPQRKTVIEDVLHEIDVSADLESGDDVPRHSTPSEFVISTAKERNTPLGGPVEEVHSTPELLNDSSESVVNGDSTATTSNVTREVPQFDEGGRRVDKKRKYEPSAMLRNSYADSAPTESPDISGLTGEQTGFGSAPNEERDKLDRLLNIREHELQSNLRDVEAEKPHDRIASILSERRKAEEAERLRFAESSVRDTDYELFTSRPLDLLDRSSPLKDLDDSGNLLHEDMTLDEFLVEVEKLVEKLRSIEELITTEMDSDDNVKDELAKHVVR